MNCDLHQKEMKHDERTFSEKFDKLADELFDIDEDIVVLYNQIPPSLVDSQFASDFKKVKKQNVNVPFLTMRP